jgi:hypothetical protein
VCVFVGFNRNNIKENTSKKNATDMCRALSQASNNTESQEINTETHTYHNEMTITAKKK